MAKRRGDGEGTIYKETKRLSDGSKAVYWRGELFRGYDSKGKKKVLRFRGRTREEVQNQLALAVADGIRGVLADPSKETVGQFLTRWLEDSVKHSVRPRTYTSYAKNISLHVIPEIGAIPLRKLTPQDVQGLYGKKLECLSPRTVQYLHAILHRAFEQASKWLLVSRNVCDSVDRPRAPRKPMHTLTPEEAERFLKAAEGDRWYALYVLAVTCGMRQGELLGLTWPDVGIVAGMLTVRRQLQWNRESKRFELTETKGGKGRHIALSPMAVRALQMHRWRQEGEARKHEGAWDGSWGLVFSTEVGTPVNHGNMLRRSFYPLLAKAEVPRIRFHDLRHTCATLLLAAGEHPKVVQEMLGHASITLTLDTYSHVLPSMQEAAALKMEALLRNAALVRCRDDVRLPEVWSSGRKE